MTETTPADTAPFNNPAAGSGYMWLHATNAVLLVGLWVFAVAVYGSLPDQVPGHIGTSGVTRWDAKQNSAWLLLPIIATVQTVVMYGVSAAASGGPSGLNVPAKKRLLTLPREGQRYAMQPVRGFIFGIATWLLVLTGYIQVYLYRVALAGPGAELPAGRLLPFTGVMLALMLLMAFSLSRRVNARIDAWERHHGAAGT
jgi:hypothetical protein